MRTSREYSSKTLKKFSPMSRRNRKKFNKKYFSSNYSLGQVRWTSDISSESFSSKRRNFFAESPELTKDSYILHWLNFVIVSFWTQEMQFSQSGHNYSAKFDSSPLNYRKKDQIFLLLIIFSTKWSCGQVENSFEKNVKIFHRSPNCVCQKTELESKNTFFPPTLFRCNIFLHRQNKNMRTQLKKNFQSWEGLFECQKRIKLNFTRKKIVFPEIVSWGMLIEVRTTLLKFCSPKQLRNLLHRSPNITKKNVPSPIFVFPHCFSVDTRIAVLKILSEQFLQNPELFLLNYRRKRIKLFFRKYFFYVKWSSGQVESSCESIAKIFQRSF